MHLTLKEITKYRQFKRFQIFVLSFPSFDPGSNPVAPPENLLTALREIEAFERDDWMLETARSLVKNAVDVLVRLHHTDRRTAHVWIKEASD